MSKHEVNIDFFVRYFEFQFSRYSGTYSRGYGKNKIMFPWLVGKKALDSWENRDINKNWIIKYKLNKEVVLRLRTIFAEKKKQDVKFRNKELFLGLIEHEESSKQKFHNMNQGIVYCDLYTTLYHPQSKWCKTCDNDKECIERIKKIYPELHKIRINEHKE